MTRTMKVTGTGKLSVKPDTTVLMITAEATCPDYEMAVSRSAAETKLLKMVMKKAGLNPDDLKTTSFSIDTEYESYRDNRDNYRKRFVGYQYEHYTKISFPNDNQQLGRVLAELAESGLDVTFTIRHTVKDVDAVKDALLAKAVENSKNRAEILAKAAGVRLGNIETIDYSWGEMNIYTNTVDRMVLADAVYEGASSYNIDIDPDDIDVQDTVTIVWEIEK